MKQRVKRDKGGKFNGSTSGGKKTTAKKTAAKKAATQKAAAQQRQAAQFQRALSAGNNRVARVDKRTDAADKHLDRAFGHSSE